MGNSRVPEQPAPNAGPNWSVLSVFGLILAYSADASGLVSDVINIFGTVSPPKPEPVHVMPQPTEDHGELNARQESERKQHEDLQALIAAVRDLEKANSELQRQMQVPDSSPVPAPRPTPRPVPDHYHPMINVARLDNAVVGVSRGKGAGGRRELSLSSTPVKIDVLPQVRLANLTARWLIEGSPPIDAGQFNKLAPGSAIVIKRYPMPEVNQSYSGVLEIQYEDADRIGYLERLPFAVSRCPDHIHLILDSPSLDSELLTN